MTYGDCYFMSTNHLSLRLFHPTLIWHVHVKTRILDFSAYC